MARFAPFFSTLTFGCCAVLALGCCGMAGRVARPALPPPPPEPPAQKIGYLSEMQEFDVRVGYGRFGKRGMLGFGLQFGEQDHEITVGGNKYPHGLSMHPPSSGLSSVSYRLVPKSRTFHGWAALNDTFPGEPAVATACTFKILGDGKELWTSQPNKEAGKAEAFKVGVQGVDVLQLQVHCPGIQTCTRAVWLEPKVDP